MTANVYLFDGWEEEKMAKGNRCVERTCEMLRKAYGELAIEKDEEKITVQEVVDRSGLSRHALYDHYGSVDALARDVKENFEKRLNACIQQMAMAADKTDPLPLLEGLSQFIMDSEDQCKLLLMACVIMRYKQKNTARKRHLCCCICWQVLQWNCIQRFYRGNFTVHCSKSMKNLHTSIMNN